MNEKLSAADRDAALAGLTNWTHHPASDSISREWKFPDFIAAFGFMTRVALLAQEADHHPDWSNSFGVVRITLSTHDAGGLSQKDIDLARRIDALQG
jgi:4a-hydroxytetrahydrobiopterin dehydratase